MKYNEIIEIKWNKGNNFMVNFSASKCEVKRGQSSNSPTSALGLPLHKEHQIS